MLVGKDLGPFRIEKELGSGAMGTVYRAENRDTGQKVAIKMIGIGQLGNDTALARFEREANILKQLRHPNIVRLIGSGRWKKVPFIAMEYVEGESLDHVLARRSRYSWEEVVAIGEQLCRALQHSHDKGIIHRDVKPSNLMVLADGTIKLTDFGIAKDTDVTALTAQNVTVGTAAYMSPEQCKGVPNLTPKSDLYSLGVVFFELLTGRKPFMKDSPIDMFMAHVNEEAPRVGQLALDVPAKLDVLIHQLMEKMPEHRPRDAAMVAAVLDEVLQDALDLRSAGVAAATARRGDRPGGAYADETDKEAARTLRGALLKKKIRKKTKPVYERGWFVLGAICAFLFAAFAGLYFVLRPPSAERLYAQAAALVEAKERDRARPVLQHYLAIYGNRSDTDTQQVRNWYEEIETERREQVLFTRVYSKLNLAGDDDATRIGREALHAEDDGDFAKADEHWAQMEAQFKDADRDEQVWAWLARKKRADLKDVSRRQKLLEDAVLAAPDSAVHKPEGEAERRDMEALRYEAFGDLPAARDRWLKVQEDLAKAFDQRPWVLLACRKARDLKATVTVKGPEEKALRIDLVKGRLKQAVGLANGTDAASLRDARVICQEVAELYGTDPDAEVKSLAQEAARLLRNLPEPRKP